MSTKPSPSRIDRGFHTRLSATAMLAIIGFLAPSRAVGEMRRCETEHYIIHTDVEPELADDLSRRMDIMYGEYAERLSQFLPPASEKKGDVRIFANHKDYARLAGNLHSDGVFMESRNLLAAALVEHDRDDLRRTLQHEAFHQFAFHAIGRKLPAWLNEGLAQVFEEGIFTGKGFTLGQAAPWRVRLLQADIAGGRIVDFREFLNMDYQQWTRNMRNEPKGLSQYNQAWAMAHFLVFAVDKEGNLKFRDRVIDMLRDLHRGSDGMAAFTGAFGDNIAGFQRRFTEYASQLTPTPAATYVEYQAALAELLAQLQARDRTFTNVQSFREFVLKSGIEPPHRKDEAAWAAAPDVASYFKDVDGHTFDSSQLFFEFREGAPIRDMVCRPASGLRLRTRFIENEGKCEHETLVEPQ